MFALPADRVAVKICGLTNRDDALAAISAGADLLGFNTWRGTRRFIDLDANAGWIASLPAMRVVLTVNAPIEEVARTAALPFVDAIQLHGDEDAAFCAAVARFGKPLIKALRVRGHASFVGAESYSTPHVLLDASVPGVYGGTGTRVDVEMVSCFQRAHPALTLWLAGGLTPENVAEAVAAVRPAVVDVASGVESAPGRKDFAKMRDFVAAARNAR